MTLEDILNTDHFTALPEGTIIEEELNCQDKEIELLPNISTLLRASEFIDLGIINDQATTSVTAAVDTATVQSTSFTASVDTAAVQAINATQSEADSADDLPISEYLRKFLQKDVPQQEHITKFPQQVDVMETEEVSEPTPKIRPIPQDAIPKEPPKK